MPKQFWWPGSLASQRSLMQNFGAKIPSYQATLSLTLLQVGAMTALCDAFIGAYDSTLSAKDSMKAMTQWRDEVFYGEPTGNEAPQAPVFAVVGNTSYTRGVVTQFIACRELIVNLPNYTETIGEDLGIVGSEVPSRPADEVMPELKAVKVSGYTVNLSGSMQGFDAMRVEYAKKGGGFQPVAFLTNLPGSFEVTPAVADQPEVGMVRTIFIKRNAEFGNYSPNYPVTVSE